MGFLDGIKKAVAKKPPAELVVPPERKLPKQIHGVDEKWRRLVREIKREKQNKHLGLVIDATGSRAPAWEMAQKILKKIFHRLFSASGLHIRLVYFGGKQIGDMGWSADLPGLQRRMAEVSCRFGRTQITEALDRLLTDEHGRMPGNVILIGDSFEETVEGLKKVLAEYRRRKIRIFSFFERGIEFQCESDAEKVFRKIAKVTEGVFQEYREDVYLDELMVAVATYAAEGPEGLDKLTKENSRAAVTLKRELLLIESKTGK